MCVNGSSNLRGNGVVVRRWVRAQVLARFVVWSKDKPVVRVDANVAGPDACATSAMRDRQLRFQQ